MLVSIGILCNGGLLVVVSICHDPGFSLGGGILSPNPATFTQLKLGWGMLTSNCHSSFTQFKLLGWGLLSHFSFCHSSFTHLYTILFLGSFLFSLFLISFFIFWLFSFWILKSFSIGFSNFLSFLLFVPFIPFLWD